MKNLKVGEMLSSKTKFIDPFFVHKVRNNSVTLITWDGHKISLPLRVVKEECKKASKKDIIFFISEDIKRHLYNDKFLKIYDSLEKLRVEVDKLNRDWYKDL